MEEKKIEKKKPEVFSLLIARREYKKLLNPLESKYKNYVRKIIGRKKSLSELIRQIDNYKEQKFFVIDLGAVREKDNELINALTSIKFSRRDVRLIVFAPEAKAGDELLKKLIYQGFTNIIADSSDRVKDKWQQIVYDLFACFSLTGLSPQKWMPYLRAGSLPAALFGGKTLQPSIPDYSKCRMVVDFYGAGKRVGTTSAALLTSAYLARGNAKIQFVFESKKEFDAFSTFYDSSLRKYKDGAEIGSIFFTFHGAEVENDCDFNFIIRDKGLIKSNADPDSLTVLVGGVGYSDITYTYKAQKELCEKKSDYICMISFSDKKTVRQHLLFTNYPTPVFVPFAVDVLKFPDSGIEEFNRAFGHLAEADEDVHPVSICNEKDTIMRDEELKQRDGVFEYIS